MNHELAKTLTTALVQFIDRERPEGTMDCSNVECTNLENAFNADNYPYIDAFIKNKLTKFTEFEAEFDNAIRAYRCEEFEGDYFQWVKHRSKKLIDIVRKEYVSGMPMPEDTVIFQKGVEEGRRLEREEMKEELAKKHLDGYCMGREDTLREMKDFVESHFNPNKAKEGEDLTDLYYKEYEGNPKPIPVGYNTNSGTSTLKAEG